MYLRTNDPLQFSSLLAEPATKAAPTLSKDAEKRIAKLAKVMTAALKLATDATPFLKTQAQRELLKLVVESLGTFFPRGFGTVNEKGVVVGGSKRLRFDAMVRDQGGVGRPYVYDVRLFISDENSTKPRGQHRSIGTWASQIHLYVRQLSKSRPNELVGTAVHEMIHMLLSMMRSFEGKFGEETARNFPSNEVAASLNVKNFSAHRVKLEAHFKKLTNFLERDAGVVFDDKTTTTLTNLLTEEVLVRVFNTRVSFAIASLDAERDRVPKKRVGAGLSVGFVPEEFVKVYLAKHWFPSPAVKASLKTPEAQRIIAGMSEDLLALVGAVEQQIGPE